VVLTESFVSVLEFENKESCEQAYFKVNGKWLTSMYSREVVKRIV